MKIKCPRARIKNIVRHHDDSIRMQKKVELLLYFDYMMFLRRLAKEAEKHAKGKKENGIDASHIKAVRKSVLKSMRA